MELLIVSLGAAVLLYFAQDIYRFWRRKVKEAPPEGQGHGTHAGGVLFVQGDRTYYQLPNGSRRKIADYAMDLTPASKDMQKFEQVMAEAYKQHEDEKRQKEKEAVALMFEAARADVKQRSAADASAD